MKTLDTIVKVKIGDVEHKVPYTKRIAESWAEARQDCHGEDGALIRYNYGADLKVKSQVRIDFLAKMQGPEILIAKAAKLYAAAMGISEEQALIKLKADREAIDASEVDE